MSQRHKNYVDIATHVTDYVCAHAFHQQFLSAAVNDNNKRTTTTTTTTLVIQAIRTVPKRMNRSRRCLACRPCIIGLAWVGWIPVERGQFRGWESPGPLWLYGISGVRSTFSTLFGRWQQRCGLLSSVLQQLVLISELSQSEQYWQRSSHRQRIDVRLLMYVGPMYLS